MVQTSGLGGAEWVDALDREFNDLSTACFGANRSPREVCPRLAPVVNSGANSPTTAGLAGSATSTTAMPGSTCGHELGPDTGIRGSPTPHRDDPSVRLPM